jgi:hypothetical protein
MRLNHARHQRGTRRIDHRGTAGRQARDAARHLADAVALHQHAAAEGVGPCAVNDADVSE